MKIVLVGGRNFAADGAVALSAALCALGHDAQALSSGRRAPGFLRVQAQVIDHGLEIAMTRRLRQERVDVVHVLAYGGGNSCATPWIARGMGVPVVVDAVPEHLLCHRGTLVHAGGQRCATFDDAPRCRACCDAAPRGLARLVPFARSVQFQNRLEIALGHLQLADRVLVASASASALLAEAGIPARLLAVLPPGQRDAATLAAVYAELASGS